MSIAAAEYFGKYFRGQTGTTHAQQDGIFITFGDYRIED